MVESNQERELAEASVLHLVVYGSDDGELEYVAASGLDEAFELAEHLANDDDNASARIFELSEVEIEYRNYYRVEITDEQASAGSGQQHSVSSSAASASVGRDEQLRVEKQSA